MLVISPEELAERSAQVLSRRPGETLLAEEYLSGELRTLETLGDGKRTWVLGGFRTRLSPLPFFIEERLTWSAPVPDAAREHVLGALGALDVTFGACHTEYVEGSRGPALIEVNDRLIGDHCDFVLSDLLGVDLFELVLRVHLGEPLPAAPPRPWGGAGHAVIDYVVADHPGTLTAVPPAGPRPSGERDVLLSYRPLRAAGDRIVITHTNRDYLGVVSAIGTGRRGRGEGGGDRQGAGQLAGHGIAIVTGGRPGAAATASQEPYTERVLATRIIDTLLREDYGGLSRRVRLR